MHHPTHCLNCEHHLTAADNFCCNCGQPANTHPRITLHHINHEVLHAVTHADKGFFFLVKELATQPGAMIKEYLAGKHKKFYSPFSFFFVILGIYVISNTFFKPFRADMDVVKNGQTVTYPAGVKTESQKLKYNKIKARSDKMMNFMNTKTNIVLCISTPFIAFLMFILFHKKLFYAEHLVAVTFINSFLNLLSIFIFTPLMHFSNSVTMYHAVTVLMLLAHIIYVSIVYHSVLSLPASAKGYIKSFGAAVFAIGGWMIISYLFIFAYSVYGIL